MPLKLSANVADSGWLWHLPPRSCAHTQNGKQGYPLHAPVECERIHLSQNTHASIQNQIHSAIKWMKSNIKHSPDQAQQPPSYYNCPLRFHTKNIANNNNNNVCVWRVWQITLYWNPFLYDAIKYIWRGAYRKALFHSAQSIIWFQSNVQFGRQSPRMHYIANNTYPNTPKSHRSNAIKESTTTTANKITLPKSINGSVRQNNSRAIVSILFEWNRQWEPVQSCMSHAKHLSWQIIFPIFLFLTSRCGMKRYPPATVIIHCA